VKPDYSATITLVAVALLALAAAWWLPWWTMEARAPQYGQRVLIVQVNPTGVQGDIFELDALGHYVGIKPLGNLARFERSMAPVGMGLACLGLVAAPWLRRRWLRALALLPVIAMPALFLADVDHWMNVATNDRDPHAALSLTVKNIDTKIVGKYSVGQFTVNAVASAGLFGVGTAGLLSIGLIFAAPLPLPRRRGHRLALALALLAGSNAHAGEVADAVAAAREGDTVMVKSGVHREHLVLDKKIRLHGEPGAILDGGGQGTVVRIEAGGVELRDLTIRGSGASYTTEDAGVRIDHAAGARIENVRVEDVLFGVFAAQADRCVIERSRILGKDLPEVRRGDGIRLWYSSGCRIGGNTMERSRDLVIWYSSNTTVENNLVRTSRYGLHYMFSDHNRFSGNRFEDNQVGAAIMNSRDIALDKNAFSFSRGGYGLLLKDADDVFIRDNRFVGNGTGLFVDGAPQSRGARVEVRGNLFARNDAGIALEPRSQGLAIWENAFIGNRDPVLKRGTGADGNQWAVGGRGNYWSEALVYDRDGDGVSELPYRLESTWEVLADRHPTLAFFGGTPAADALDLASRLFPLFAPRPRLTDPAPLVRAPLDDWLRGEPPHRAPLALTGAAMLLLAALARKALA
jgi:nitrous oxidase accessory protein